MARTGDLACLMVMVFLAPMLAGCTDLLGSNSAPTATMSVDPSGTVKAGDPVTFSAAGSSDPDGDDLTFEWDFGDGNTGTGLTTSHTYAQPGNFVAKLAVGDGTHEASISKTITVVDSSAREPNAEITSSKDNDCEGEESSASGNMVIVWVCEDDNDVNEREVEVSATVTLDGSDSWAGCDPDDSSCYSEEYLVEWKWDLDTYTDSDNDGITDNDVDATGETYTWDSRPAGAWEVKLTVVDNNGFEDSTKSMVYVNYRGVWKDFVIDRASPNPVIMTWEYPVTYDQDSKDRIRYMRAKLSYPRRMTISPEGVYRDKPPTIAWIFTCTTALMRLFRIPQELRMITETQETAVAMSSVFGWLSGARPYEASYQGIGRWTWRMRRLTTLRLMSL